MTALYAIISVVAIVVVVLAINGAMRKRVTSRHDSIEDAMSDETEPLPSSHLIPDNETAAGDTPEAHDEINPHDLPAGHPGREAAEEQAEQEPGDDGARTTRGDDELARAAPKREERLDPATRDGTSSRAGGDREQRDG
jgi:hypothetical protein